MARWCLSDDSFSRFDRAPACDRQADTHTTASIALTQCRAVKMQLDYCVRWPSHILVMLLKRCIMLAMTAISSFFPRLWGPYPLTRQFTVYTAVAAGATLYSTSDEGALLHPVVVQTSETRLLDCWCWRRRWRKSVWRHCCSSWASFAQQSGLVVKVCILHHHFHHRPIITIIILRLRAYCTLA